LSVLSFKIYSFEFVKSIGSRIVPLKLPQGQEASAKVIKHTSGTGPIYIRSLSKLEIDEVYAVCSKILFG
jgi:hypothetical protein